jgi:hypothetical protein
LIALSGFYNFLYWPFRSQRIKISTFFIESINFSPPPK